MSVHTYVFYIFFGAAGLVSPHYYLNWFDFTDQT